MENSNISIGQPLLIEPEMVDRVWGGNRLGGLFGKTVPSGRTIGESWELADRNDVQTLVTEGDFAGQTLRKLMEERPLALLGTELASRKPPYFPLLGKYVDSGKPLSVQVHPDDDGAKRLGLKDRGKCECWFIVHAEPGSSIVRGVEPGVSRASFEEALQAGRVEETLHSFEPKVGDVVAIPPGMVHAIGEGIVLAEIQQNSDITFRVYDYGRLGLDGKPRALHVNESLETIRFDGDFGSYFDGDMGSDCVVGTSVDVGKNARRTDFLTGMYFDLKTTEVAPDGQAFLKDADDSPVVLFVTAGCGRLNGYCVEAGRTVLLPADLSAEDARVVNESGEPLVCLTSTPTADA